MADSDADHSEILGHLNRKQQRMCAEPEEWVLVAAYVLTFVVGVLGNILVCFAVCRNKEMRTVTNIFMVNLAVADLNVILVLLPSSLLVDVTETWLLGKAMCKISIALGTTCIAVSILTLCAISLERWYAICRPLSFHSNIKRARITIAAIWAVSIGVALPELLASTLIPYRPDTVFRTMCYPALWKRRTVANFQICLMMFFYFLPLCLIACLYTHIAVVLWRKRVPGTSEMRSNFRSAQISKRASTDSDNRVSSRRKAVKMLVVIVVVFAMCFLPNHTLNILRYLEQLKKVPNLRMFALIAHWCTFFNSCINPIIYNFMSDKFRKEFRVALSLCRHCSRVRTPQGSMVRYQMTAAYTRNLTVKLSNNETAITKRNSS
ncbi:orexin receptor type 2-like [Mya arenaria]|uniref:orexin receptor type 2-like n=1 Tax=Mya arenaria TaxID=6604 RepID=UPI0022E67D14|nr:orexin receptor type 2-like [Mya arenaria]